MLKEKYEEEVRDRLMNELGYDNTMEVPEIEKVVVNMGISEHEDPSIIDGALENLKNITGQSPVVTRARKSISDFDIRRGIPVGCKVTLRGERAYEFLNKLYNVALPSIRDFRGLSPDSFDGRGNYSLGMDEQLVFPEITFDDVRQVQGMDITVVTSAETDREGYYLLKELGSPFRE
ncbi:50S ribosomal protein L5 [Candidatus Bipolaricaulota bacterium]|nr:50S ribosomal protein L5 [Candidatus Bipolaricaulota bacterium]